MTKILWPLVSNIIRRNKLSNTYGRFPERASGVHWGWDFYAPAGTRCYAIADGVVKMKYGHASDTGSFGLVAVLEFAFQKRKLYAAYCHLSQVTAPLGAISAGDEIGLSGNSGNANNMKGADQHLHFEIRSSARPGPGGAPARLNPMLVFGHCPLHQQIIEP